MEQPKSEMFKALSDPTRLRLINLFLTSQQGLCVCELVDALKQPQYQISKHLMILKTAGFLKADRLGTWMYYSLVNDNPDNKQLFDFLRSFLTDQLFSQDWHNLQIRLRLRENGRCVVGSVAAEKLDAIQN